MSGSENRSPVPVLIVDDEPLASAGIRRLLETWGYEVQCVTSAEQALRNELFNRFPIMLVDNRLGPSSGIALCADMRTRGYRGKIIMISGVDGDANTKADAIEAGADDYLTKPLHGRELRARMRRLLGDLEVLEFGVVKLHREERAATIEDNYVLLTPATYRLLEALVRRRGLPITAEAISRDVQHGLRSPGAPRDLVHRLRQAIGCKQDLILNDEGGWRLLGQRLAVRRQARTSGVTTNKKR